MGWAPGTAAPESREFNNGTGDWNVAGNWTPPGVPVVGDRAHIRDGDTVNVTDSPPATDVTLDGGTINVDGGHLRLGSKEGHIELATGTIILGAGTIEQVATWTRMGDRPGGTLTWNQSGGIARIYHNAGAPSANDATLDFNISGGEYHANGIPLPHPDASDPLLDIDVSGTGFVRLERIGPAHTRISLLDPGAVIAVRTEEWENFLAAVDTPWQLTEGPEADFTYVEGTGEGAPPPDEEEDGEAPFVSPWSWKDRLLPEYGEEPIRTGRNVRLGAFTWVFTGWTNEERNRWVGSHFEAFSYDHVGYYYSSADVRMMRETNPAIFLGLSFCPQILDVKAQSYLNVGGWDPSSMGDWVLRLADGGEAPNQLWSFEDTHVMDVGNPAWSDYFRDRAAMWVERAGADGVFLDGTPWGGAYYPDPSNLRDYDSREEIEAATRAFVDNLRKVTMVIDDEWKNGRQEHLDGLWDEGWMGYDSTIPTWGFDSPARWENRGRHRGAGQRPQEARPVPGLVSLRQPLRARVPGRLVPAGQAQQQRPVPALSHGQPAPSRRGAVRPELLRRRRLCRRARGLPRDLRGRAGARHGRPLPGRGAPVGPRFRAGPRLRQRLADRVPRGRPGGDHAGRRRFRF